MRDKLLDYINYWFVDPNATPKERLKRLFEIGLCIGTIMGFVWAGVVVWSMH